MAKCNPHALVIPYPAQGHVIPLMELSHRLVNRGIKVTFVNTEFNHKRVMDSISKENHEEFPIRFITISDGLEHEEDRHNIVKSTEIMNTVMPGELEEIIRTINGSTDDDDVTCVIADGSLGWAMEVAEMMKVPHRVLFSPPSAAVLALVVTVPKLIEDGIIDTEGIPIESRKIQLSPTMRPINTTNFVWNLVGDSETNKVIFESVIRNNKALTLANWVLCNSFYNLEPGAISLVPKLLPIGPLLASTRLGRSSGRFWPEDSTCLTWLDQQPSQSVVYVAFGSTGIFQKAQFEELAFGLELSGQRFLWVTRADSSFSLPDGFQTRVGTRGLAVGWAPQQNVLSHPSVACFVSHCGWNSTMEGVSNGVPFLCWPYFADQFMDEDYICDIWKIGLRLNKDEKKIISRTEISEKLIVLLNDKGIRTRASKLMEMAREGLKDGGSSSRNFDYFVQGIKK